MKKVLFLVVLVTIGFYLIRKSGLLNKPAPTLPPVTKSAAIFGDLGYVPVDPSQFDLGLLSDQVTAPTRLKLTPEGNFLLVTQITGEVLAFARTHTGWDSKPQLVTKIDTKAPGFPPDEMGLVGLSFSSQFATNHRAFLLYSYKDTDEKIYNRVSSLELISKNNSLTSKNQKLIYQATTPGNVSHQITDGVGVEYNGSPHLLILIGEGFRGELAQDVNAEAGKLILIQEDGSSPLGFRPYPNSKVQALGIRNAYVLSQNPWDDHQRFLIADTGPEKFDRLIFTNLLQDSPLNFNWDGTDSSLRKPIPDPEFPQVKDLVIFRLPETRTFTGLAFHPGKGSIPASTPESQSVLVTLFGKTGVTDNTPGKEIWLGQLTNLTDQPQIKFSPIIKRNPAAQGKLGNPIGLEIDPQTGDFFFADILEGKIYRVVILERR